MRIERLRQLINKAQKYLDKQFTEEEREAFLKTCHEEAEEEARADYFILTKIKGVEVNLKKLIQQKLRRKWKLELQQRQETWLRTYRLNLLREQLLELSRSHPKCFACKIYFGGEHSEHPNDTPIGNLCSSCFRSFQNQGYNAFIKRIPTRED